MKFQNSISATDRHGSVDAVCRRLPHLRLLPAASQETGTCSQRVSSLFPASIHELPYAHFFAGCVSCSWRCRRRRCRVESSIWSSSRKSTGPMTRTSRCPTFATASHRHELIRVLPPTKTPTNSPSPIYPLFLIMFYLKSDHL